MSTELKQSIIIIKIYRNALIEKGIEIVSKEGIHSFSLRKVAAACGVMPSCHLQPFSKQRRTVRSYAVIYYRQIFKIIRRYYSEKS